MKSIRDREQFSVRAFGYLEAARIVVSDPHRTPATLAPVLHLIGHAIELMLKEALLEKGKSLADVKAYGHKINKLWKHEKLSDFREKTKEYCIRAWNVAKRSSTFRDDFSDDPWTDLQEYMECMALLNSSSEGYPLRYTMKDGTSGPRPFLLLDTFGPLAKERLERVSTERDRN